MKGKNKGVQARLLAENPHAFYVPCGAHTLNLMVSDAAKVSMDATCFLEMWKNFTDSSQVFLKGGTSRRSMWTSHSSPGVKRDGRVTLTVLNLYATKQTR